MTRRSYESAELIFNPYDEWGHDLEHPLSLFIVDGVKHEHPAKTLEQALNLLLRKGWVPIEFQNIGGFLYGIRMGGAQRIFLLREDPLVPLYEFGEVVSDDGDWVFRAYSGKYETRVSDLEALFMKIGKLGWHFQVTATHKLHTYMMQRDYSIDTDNDTDGNP